MPSSQLRKLSEDSLEDLSYPEMTRGSSSRNYSTTSSASPRTTGRNMSTATTEWQRSVSSARPVRTSGTDAEVSPTAPTAPRMPNPPHPPEQTPGIATPPPTTQTGGWGVAISPSRSPSYRAPGSIAASRGPLSFGSPPRSDPDEGGYTHLPTFTAPAPARPGYITRNSARASMSMPSARPQFGTANSSAHLLAESPSVSTPGSAASDPFDQRTFGAAASVRVPPPARGFSGQPPNAPMAPPRIHLNSNPTSPANTSEPIVPIAPPIVVPSPYTNMPTSNSFSSSQGPDRRPSNAPTFGTQLSGVSVTSALDLKGGRLTAAERRNQRMKQVMGKKGKKERDVKGAGGVQVNRKPFQSTRLKEEIYKPWLEKKDPAQRWARWITLLSILIGLAVMGVICWDGYNSVPRLGNLCPVLNDDFSNGLDTSTWTREVRVDGFGHGSFDYTTDSTNNSFVQDKTLYLVPTLTSDIIGEAAIQDGYTLNLTSAGTCTSGNVSQCVAISNSSQLSVINPVMSARLTTRTSVNIRYGKIEVVARFPTGDWLWPSISMYPVNETYGKAPRSGEIDIITGRGNNASYTQRGVDYAQSSLHWGPTYELDRMWQTWGYREQRRSSYNQGFRTFGFEWNDKYLWTYIDSRVSQVVSLRFDQSFWNRGKFPSTITNTTTGDVVRLLNPWINSNNNNAPFDQPFYLSLSLAVGATDGWFPDGEGGKPWLDNSLSAMSDFWNAKNRWWSNWPSDPKTRGFAIKSVKMWKTC